MSTIKIPQKLLSGKTTEEKAEITSLYRSNIYLLTEMREIIQGEINRVIEEEEHPHWYERVYRWDLKQADFKGYRRGLRRMLKLLPTNTIDEEL